jgi:hypothetical protein
VSRLVIGSYPVQSTRAFSQDAHEGRRWSQRFLRRRHLLHALTLRKDEAADAGAAGAVGDDGFTEAIDDSEGEGRSASWDESSRERLRPLIRAHGRVDASAGFEPVSRSFTAGQRKGSPHHTSR